MTAEQKDKAELWNDPQTLIYIEEGRYIYQRALSRIISNTFRRFVETDSIILETGAGLGYLKDLVPKDYTTKYITSDYSVNNLAIGVRRREINGVAASAFELPFADSSVDCVVDMDAYDTLPNLSDALLETKRVLKKDGNYVHFQVNFPSDDTVFEDFPNYVFFPPSYEKDHTRGQMTGVKREDLERGIKYIEGQQIRGYFEQFLRDFFPTYIQVLKNQMRTEISKAIEMVLSAMPIDRLVIPSVPAYFKTKLERAAQKSGLEVEYSQFEGTVVKEARTEMQKKYPNSNEFSMEQGDIMYFFNPQAPLGEKTDIIEKASILVFVAKKVSD